MVATPFKVADGRVEGAPGGVVTGWAWNPSAPEERVTVRVYVDGRPIAHGPADTHAPGLKKAGIGDGHHAFAVALPESVIGDRPLRIAVGVDGSLERLPLLERWHETGDAAPWAAVELLPYDGPLSQPPIEDDAPPAAPEPAEVALTGRDGWLFGLTDAEGRRLQRLRSVVVDLQETATLLEQLGIRYVVAVAPAKLAVHPELATVASADFPRCARELEALARDSDSLEVFDLLPVLLDARRHGLLYLPREETLSGLGGFHVARALVKRAGPVAPGLRPLVADAIALTTTRELPADDLADLPRLGAETDAGVAAVEGVDASALRALRMPAEAHLEVEELPAPRVYERPDPPEQARAVLVGDPVIHAVAPWLAEVTSRLAVLSAARPPLVPIELEHPAVVFHLLDERRLLA